MAVTQGTTEVVPSTTVEAVPCTIFDRAMFLSCGGHHFSGGGPFMVAARANAGTGGI